MQITDCAQDKNLHLRFVKLGSDRRRLTNELLALLPEIHEREIFKKYAATIIEYAGKFGGLSKGVVLKRLRLEKHLQDKPLLKEAIRTEGVHKVALVAALVTPETEKEWVAKLENMSKLALQELSKEVRNRRGEVATNGGAGAEFGDNRGVGQTGANSCAPCKAVPVKITLELDAESSFLFLSLKKKFGGNLTNREVMKKILEMAAAATGGQKREVSTAKPAKVIPEDNFTHSITRYIPADLKRIALANSNNHCFYPNCNRLPEVFHHTERFALNQNHKSIAPLCKIHHEFAHNGLILNESQPVKNWQMRLDMESPGQLKQTGQIDNLYRRARGLVIAKFGQG
ncbi:hypothetical protein HZA42_04315 [Candidatus Peregrinibacteria bacterium]|nr:hypothetical protein [Candidatus Peregrinibacteria bacterium]